MCIRDSQESNQHARRGNAGVVQGMGQLGLAILILSLIHILDVADIQRIMGISRASAYELVHTPSFPAFRRGRLIKVSNIAFFDWMAKGSETVPGSDK